MRPSLWMLLPLLTSPYKGEETEGRSPYKGEGKCGSPDKGEESEGGPHKSLKRRFFGSSGNRVCSWKDVGRSEGSPPRLLLSGGGGVWPASGSPSFVRRG